MRVKGVLAFCATDYGQHGPSSQSLEPSRLQQHHVRTPGVRDSWLGEQAHTRTRAVQMQQRLQPPPPGFCLPLY